MFRSPGLLLDTLADNIKEARLALYKELEVAAQGGCIPACEDPNVNGTRLYPAHDNNCQVAIALAALKENS